MGRLSRTIEPMRVSAEIAVELENWVDSAVRYANLSRLELTVGEINLAITDAEKSVMYADRGDPSRRVLNRGIYADCLHQAGRSSDARAYFQEAERMLVEAEPKNRFLYSLEGYFYCDYLTAAAERAIWQRVLTVEIGKHPSLIKSCLAVSRRAQRTVRIVEERNWVRDIGLDYLTLSRTSLFISILENKQVEQETILPLVDHALDCLRRAGILHHVPLGLMTRALARCFGNRFCGAGSAKEDLDEAWEIAERGPMPLHSVDILLHRVRLFALSENHPETYPWNSLQDDLVEARRLIEKYNYWRRKEELQDIEKATRVLGGTGEG
jgi:tetratricopeptide (TPR) repeat protein